MQPECTACELISQLRILKADFEKTRIFAQEVEARGYNALLASTAFADQAYELRKRTVHLFNNIAHAIRFIEEAQNVRLRLLEVSEQIKELFSDTEISMAISMAAFSNTNFASQLNKPTLKELLYSVDKKSCLRGSMSMHEQVLSVADAAASVLQAISRHDREDSQ